MSETTLTILITSVTGILTALITAVSTAYTQITVERIKAEASQHGRVKATTAQKPLTLRSAFRSINWPLTAVITILAASLMAGILLIALPEPSPASSANKGMLSLESLPFIAFTWSTAVNASETGWAYLTIINDANSKKKYQFEYTLPLTSTNYSGAGLTFRFSEPQDLTGYGYASIDITFGAPDTRCDFILWDIANKSKSVPLSPNVALNPDIKRQRSGLSETFTIPLDIYFGEISRRDIKEIACATDTNISPGSHKVILNSIVFSK